MTALMQRKGFRTMGIAAIILVVLIVGFLVLRPTAPRAPEQAATTAELDAYLDALTAYGTPPGLSMMVVKDDAVVYEKGFGVADGLTGAAPTPQSVYHWWSMTKIPTAVAIMQLQEQGVLSLDDPVVDHLPFFQVEYPSAESEVVTIRHLLNHSSGLGDPIMKIVTGIHFPDDPPVNQTEWAKAVLPENAKLKYEPGSRAQYTNLGYVVLGAVIESVTGMTYEDYIRANILDPLAMTQTDFVYSEAMLAQAVRGSHPRFDVMGMALLAMIGRDKTDILIEQRAGNRLWFTEAYYIDVTPSTGLIGPATDASRFARMILNGGELDGQRVIAAESLALMMDEPPIAGKNQNMRGYQVLGWQTDGSGEWYEHRGGGAGFGTILRLYPQRDLGIVIMTNDTTTDTQALADLAASIAW